MEDKKKKKAEKEEVKEETEFHFWDTTEEVLQRAAVTVIAVGAAAITVYLLGTIRTEKAMLDRVADTASDKDLLKYFSRVPVA